MNEDRKKRGLAHSKFLTVVAMSALFLSSGNVMATQVASDNVLEVTEQLQSINVTGLVVDATGEPIIGASVVEKGTTNGIVTDIDGKFILSVKTGAILKISFVGYQPQEVKATPTMKIVLKEDTELLDEVVVVGYGVQKKANLTGAVTTVDLNKTMAGRPQQDVSKALQGAVPGLSITTENGDINGNASMRIRGVGTLSNSEKSNPLIVVDGGRKLKYGEMRPYQSDSNVGDYTIIDGTPYYYADWDVQDIYYSKAAPSQSHNLSVQGSSGKTNYYLSFGYDEKEGIMKVRPDELKKYNVSVNVTTNLYDWLQVGARVNYSRKAYQRPDIYSSTYQTLWRWGSFFIPSGTIDGYDTRLMAMRKQASDRKEITDLTRMNAFLKAEIIKGLTLNADFTYAIQNLNSGSEDFSVYGINWSGMPVPSYIVTKSNSAIWRDNSKQNTWTLNAYANYAKTFAKSHNLNVMVGANAEEVDYTYLYGYRKGLYDEAYPELNLASQDGQQINWSHTSRASAGYFGRINYDYKGIYLLEVNGRYDGSSRFPHNDKWAFFPSASIGYRFSEEAYFAPLKKVISNAKFRASYGEIGNEAIGNYMFEELISQRENTSATGYIYWVDGNGANANRLTQYNMPKLVSKSLTWERIRTTDIGLDLGFLNNELTVGFDWYQRENRDMLAPAQVLPNSVGATAPYDNAGTLRTRGWELNLDWHHKFGEFNVYANFNLSDSKTKVTKWNNDTKLLSSYFSGKTYGDIWGFETDRYFEESDFTGQNADGSWIYKSGVASQSALERAPFHYGPGDIKFKDLDGSGAIDGGKGTADDHGDLKVIGNSLPRYEYSFHLGGSWKGIDLDLFFQGVGKRSDWTIASLNFPMMRSADLAVYEHQSSYNRVFYSDDWKTITGYDINQGNTYPRLYPGNEAKGTVSGIANGSNNYYPQSRYLTDMSYLRLKNVTVGYTLPKEWTRKAFIEKARIYFSGSNLFLLYKGSDLPVDPEISTGDGLTSAGWGRTAPITRTFSFGIQVTL